MLFTWEHRDGPNLLNVIQAECLRMAQVGIVELFNKGSKVSAPPGTMIYVPDELVAVIVLGPGQSILLRQENQK